MDFTRCVGCRSCEIACAIEHSVSKNIYGFIFEEPKTKPRIKVYKIEDYTIPITCRHCDEPLCLKICPVNAIEKLNDGRVICNVTKCIGCKLCTLICPIGHPVYDMKLRILIKCDLCPDRVSKGMLPACVEACPTKALMYLEPEELSKYKTYSIIHKLISEEIKPIESPISKIYKMYKDVSWW